MLPLDKEAAVEKVLRSRWRVSVRHPTYPGTYVQDSHAAGDEEAKAEVLAEFVRRTARDAKRATVTVAAVHREEEETSWT